MSIANYCGVCGRRIEKMMGARVCDKSACRLLAAPKDVLVANTVVQPEPCPVRYHVIVTDTRGEQRKHRFYDRARAEVFYTEQQASPDVSLVSADWTIAKLSSEDAARVRDFIDQRPAYGTRDYLDATRLQHASEPKRPSGWYWPGVGFGFSHWYDDPKLTPACVVEMSGYRGDLVGGGFRGAERDAPMGRCHRCVTRREQAAATAAAVVARGWFRPGTRVVIVGREPLETKTILEVSIMGAQVSGVSGWFLRNELRPADDSAFAESRS